MTNPEVVANLKVLRLTEYEGYKLPFRTQAVTDAEVVFVDDLRADDDNSLGPVPRITTFAQLKEVFKLGIDHSLGRDSTPPGEFYWSIIGFYLRTGVAAFIPKVLAENGQPVPAPGAFVFAHWPGAPEFSDTPNPLYHSRAVGGFTNVNGDVGFGYSGGAVTGAGGGVYDIWVSADPPFGTRFYSDAAIRLGWWGGTDHLTPNPIFQAVRKPGAQPPTGDSRLVIYDKQGVEVGFLTLVTDGGGGRIALVVNDQELSSAKLE